MDHETFQSWLEAYGRAWTTRDPKAAANLFAEGATYQETPFVAPLRGRQAILEYWFHVSQSQEEISFGFEVLAVTQETGIARWWASLVRVASKVRVKLDGIFVISLDAENRCATLREWWHRQEDRTGESGAASGRLAEAGSAA
jgi:hypothetical protein